MSFFSELKRFFSEFSEVPAMAKVDEVARQVPQNVMYVTIGPALVLADAASFLYKTAKNQNLGYLPEVAHFAAPGYSQKIYYLAHDGANIMLIREGGIQFATPIANISEVKAYMRGGFVVSLHDGRGLAVATQTPINVPPNATYRTVSGMTNAFSGWDNELAPLGVKFSF